MFWFSRLFLECETWDHQTKNAVHDSYQDYLWASQDVLNVTLLKKLFVQNRTNPKSKMTEQLKRVSFDENIHVEKIPSRSSWSNDDLSTMHYSYEELEEFRRRECRRIWKLSMKSRLGIAETGKSIAEAETLRQKRVEDGIHIVLQEQLIQSYRGEERNPDDIARAYSGATRESKQFARHRAFDIALQVLEHVDEETILWSCCTGTKSMESGDKYARLSDVGSTCASSPTRSKQIEVLPKMIVVPIE